MITNVITNLIDFSVPTCMFWVSLKIAYLSDNNKEIRELEREL